MSEIHRAVAFVDGFNVYHFLKEFHQKYKWLDYCKLANEFLPSDATLTDVYYFTAYPKWDQAKIGRHQIYEKALRAVGVKVKVNEFHHRSKRAVVPSKHSNQYFWTPDGNITGYLRQVFYYEEKSTDVGIATKLITLAAKNEFETALLISGDTDFVPVVEAMRDSFSDKILRMAVPSDTMPDPFNTLLPNGLARLITAKQLRKCQLDDPLIRPGKTSLSRPLGWPIPNDIPNPPA